VITEHPISWGIAPDPVTFLGNADWRDYEASADVLLEQPGHVTLVGRMDSADWFQDGKARWPSGYVLTVQQDGAWELNSAKFKNPTVKLAAGTVPFSLKTWHHLALVFKGSTIQASIDDASVANVTDNTHKNGMVGIGTGWNKAQFDNFSIK